MLNKLQTRLKSDEGFTLIELLVVIIIIGILLAIAIPSYLSFKDRANNTAAKADIRAAVPAMESLNADSTDGLYPAAADLAMLQTVDAGIKVVSVKVSTDRKSYCLDATVGGKAWHQNFGAAADADPSTGTCP